MQWSSLLHVVRVLLKQREIAYCLSCNKFCLEPSDIEKREDNIHWPCAQLKITPEEEWICQTCITELEYLKT